MGDIAGMRIVIDWDDGSSDEYRWRTEVYPVTVDVERKQGWPKAESGEFVVAASRWPRERNHWPTGVDPRAAATELLTAWIEAACTPDSERSGDTVASYRAVIARARIFAVGLGVEWDDSLVPDHVHEVIALLAPLDATTRHGRSDR